MMPVPQPKTQLTVTITTPVLLDIETITPEASAWVEANVPQFGKLNRDGDTQYWVRINSNYDANEVAAYIRALGQEEEKEQP